VALGISTLMLSVPVPLAATHQAGSLTLLTFALWLAHALRASTPAGLAATAATVATRVAPVVGTAAKAARSVL
jgi:heme A synthase